VLAHVDRRPDDHAVVVPRKQVAEAADVDGVRVAPRGSHASATTSAISAVCPSVVPWTTRILATTAPLWDEPCSKVPPRQGGRRERRTVVRHEELVMTSAAALPGPAA
jgi:hypothetical protein